jgi:hypothetical protein
MKLDGLSASRIADELNGLGVLSPLEYKRSVGDAITHKELVDARIDKVYVFPGKRIEIVWKIADFTAVG